MLFRAVLGPQQNRANVKAGSHKIPLLESEICAGNVFSKSI